MTLSVTGAAGALAALQALSASSTSASSKPTTAATAAPTATTPDSSLVAGATPSQSLFATVDGLGHAITAADAAGAAGSNVLDLLQQMYDAAGQAADPDSTESQRAGLDQDFQSAAAKVAPTLSGATVGGTNLIDGSATTGLKAPLGDGASISLTPQDLTLGGPTLNLAADASLATPTAAAASLASLDGAIGATGQALSTLRGQADQLRSHGGALQALGGALASPQDDSDDTMRLLALQISQQLSATSTPVANQTPQSVLSLFRS